MTQHRIGTREEWQAARDELLTMEKELTRRNDELAERRRNLPWVPIEKDFTFATDDGPRSLAQLFDGRTQLLIYHFMFGSTYEAGCPTCSSIADSIDGLIAHLNARGVTMLCASGAPVEKLQAYRRRMGWRFGWVSTYGSDFSRDFGFSLTEDESQTRLQTRVAPVLAQASAMCGTDPAGYVAERPGLLAFALADGAVHHTYTATARGLEPLMGYYGLLDRTPMGRNEGDPPAWWFRRHDEYPRVPATSS
jgi:predicted dithiol-disulfide oxidoreductase (DUF899 family)